MRRWVILDGEGVYKGEAKTFENAIQKVGLQPETSFIVNQEQYSDIQIDGWCEGGLKIKDGVMTDVEEVEDIVTYWSKEDEKAYRRSMIL